MGFIIAMSSALPTLCGSQRMALASGSQNDEIFLNFVRWQADKSPFAADVQPAIGVHWVSAGGRGYRRSDIIPGVWKHCEPRFSRSLKTAPRDSTTSVVQSDSLRSRS